MRWWLQRRTPPETEEADHAHAQAVRAGKDADQIACRVDAVSDQLAETLRNNHFGAAVARSIIRGA